MKVSLIDYTGDGMPDPENYAAAVLIFTKNTRLEMNAEGLDFFCAMPWEQKLKELQYMANTIPSSWEFVDYTFMIEGVTRAFTHQLVRTRTASFSQQTMRVLKMQEWGYLTGPTILRHGGREGLYREGMDDIGQHYEALINMGASIEDARGILPTNILTNIVMKIDLRNFVDLFRKRSSSRVQGEYRDVLEAMKAEVLRVHPFASLFLERTFDQAAADLETMVLGVVSDPEARTRMVKLLDQIKATQ